MIIFFNLQRMWGYEEYHAKNLKSLNTIKSQSK